MSALPPFHVHWDTWGLIVALALYLEFGVSRLAFAYAPPGEERITSGQRRAYYTGLVLLGLASTWPIHDIGETSLFTFHMIEHVTMSLVVPPLLLYGAPWWLIRATVKPILPVLRWLTHPLIALLLFNAILAGLHYEVFIEAMISSELAHFGVHAALFISAILMWWPVMGPIPDIPRLEPLPRMGYLFLQSLVPTIPAAFFTFATGPVYDIYDSFDHMFGWSTVTDQTIAGLIMKLGGGLILWTVIAITFFRWNAEEERLDRPTPVSRVL